MSKTYHTKKAFKQKIYNIIQSQEKQSAESGVTTLATEAQFFNAYSKAKAQHTRHPSGTKATGLKQWFKGKPRVADQRDHLGETEVQSSRLRIDRRAGNHFARLKIKKDLRTLMNGLNTKEERSESPSL